MDYLCCAAQITYDDASAREADADDTHLAVRSAGLDLRMGSYMAGRLDCKVLWQKTQTTSVTSISTWSDALHGETLRRDAY